MTAKTYCIKEGYVTRDEYIQNIQIGSGDKFQDRVYAKAREVCERNNCMTVLDIGCGSGYKLIKYFSDKIFLGLELEPNLSWLKETYPHYHFQLSDFDNPPGGRFDLVICSDVIEHLLDPDQLLEFVQKLNFGTFVVSTPERDNMQLLQKGFTWDGPPHNQYHVREWTEDEFEQYISETFNIQEQVLTKGEEVSTVNECQIVVATRK
tara:strand:- start:518 stop:1138 length:621 start_codon:yes stop_codon:yes gene_type:complete